ncbi:MAG TPA: hypothetical protein VMV18_07580, partial [bacterium]|nr:hypothetical protein [bacterium]
MSLVVIASGLLLSGGASAGRLAEDWDSLPQAASLSFSQASIGLTTRGGERFVLERSSLAFSKVDEHTFLLLFPDLGAPAAVRSMAGDNPVVTLNVSGDAKVTATDASCYEGDHTPHRLFLGGKPLKDHVNACSSVSAAEVVGSQLWLGTRADEEYGEYPAQGLVVQTLKGSQLVGAIGSEQGLEVPQGADARPVSMAGAARQRA